MKIVINNGYLIDPKNNISSKKNLGIANGKIIEISDEILKGDMEIDGSNKIITPGFVDMHMHEDKIKQGEIQIDIFEKMLRMGVTTAIGGNCGVGVSDVEEYYNAAKGNIPINFGMLLPHSLLREKFNETDRYKSIDSAKINEMYEYGRKIIEENKLFGISFGLEYVPGTNTEELTKLSKLGENKIMAAHLRRDNEDAIDSVEELLEATKNLNTTVQISHIGSMAGYGQMEKFLKFLDEKKKEGKNLMCDCYPYTAFSTYIGAATFDGDFMEKHQADYNTLEVIEGEYRGKRCDEELFHKLRKKSPNTMVIGHMMLEDDIDMALKYPSTAIISDGILGDDGNGHPRAAGTFPRFIGRYIRDKKLLSLEEGIRKITSLPSEIMKISKGSLEVGADADIVVFDLKKIQDKATFENSKESPKGIDYVLVNGEIALDNGKILNNKLGKIIKSR